MTQSWIPALCFLVILFVSCTTRTRQPDLFDTVYLGILQGKKTETLDILQQPEARNLSPADSKDLEALICTQTNSNPGLCAIPENDTLTILLEAQQHIYVLDYSGAYTILKRSQDAFQSNRHRAVSLIYYRLFIKCMLQRSLEIPSEDLSESIVQLKSTASSDPVLNKYMQMLQYYMESLLLFSRNSYTEALIPAFAGLAFHNNVNPEIRFPGLYTEIVYQIAKLYSHDVQYSLSEYYFNLINSKNIPADQETYEIVQTNLFFLADLQGNFTLRDSLFRNIHDSSQIETPWLRYSRNLIDGYYYFLHQRPAQARQYYFQATSLFDSTAQCNSLLLSLYNYIAESYLSEAQIDSAIYYNDLALTSSCMQFQKHREQVWHMLYTRTEIAYALCQAHLNTTACSQASKAFYEQQTFLDTIFDITDPHFADATVYNTEAYLGHLLHIASLYAADSICFEAAAIIELSKSRSLIRGLHGASRDQLSVSHPQYRECSKNLSELLNTTNNLRELRPVDDTIYLSLFRYFHQKKKLEEQFSVPVSENLKSANDRNAEWEIEDYCHKYNTQIFQFLGTENSYYAVYINPDTAAFYNISKVLVDSCLREWRSNLHLQDSLGSQTISALQTLYLILLRDHVDKSIRNIVVLPDLQLNGFPFEVLMQNSGDKTQYLIENHSVSYHFSIASLIKEQPTSIQVQSVSIVSWSNPKTIAKNLTEYPELPGGYSECLRFCQLLGDKCAFLSGEQLTVDNFERNLTSDILHLSTHAFSSDINRLDNYFLLRNRDEAIKYYAYNLPSTENHLSHVVLSACESGIGMYLPGDGVYSISREFLRAGSECVTKTLWPIQDLKTASLFAIYYDELKKGSTVIEAIRTAKMEYLREANVYNHPYVWAGIIVEGNPFMSFQF